MHRSSRDVGGLEKGQCAGGSVDFLCACARERVPARARERAREIRHDTRENERDMESLHVCTREDLIEAARREMRRGLQRGTRRESPQGRKT